LAIVNWLLAIVIQKKPLSLLLFNDQYSISDFQLWRTNPSIHFRQFTTPWRKELTMNENIVLEKSYKFALRIVALYRKLTEERHEYVQVIQLSNPTKREEIIYVRSKQFSS
jgi:hypothetical protein